MCIRDNLLFQDAARTGSPTTLLHRHAAQNRAVDRLQTGSPSTSLHRLYAEPYWRLIRNKLQSYTPLQT